MKEKKIITPGNKEKAAGATTIRQQVRRREDEEYLPVIVKRNDEVVRHSDDVLEHAINEGLEQLERPNISLILSSIAAGLILAFSVMGVGVIASFDGIENSSLRHMLIALIYPLGFVICIMSGSQLFTEHTATAVYPVLDRRAGPKTLLRLWVLVIFGNLIGAIIAAGLLTLADEVIGAKSGYIYLAVKMLDYSSPAIFFSAVLAGWLMALGAWLVLATPPTFSQIVSIYFTTFLIGLGGLHHSIAGSVEMFTAMFVSDQFSVMQATGFIGLALLGNLVGGSMFVAILNYGHIRHSRSLE